MYKFSKNHNFLTLNYSIMFHKISTFVNCMNFLLKIATFWHRTFNVDGHSAERTCLCRLNCNNTVWHHQSGILQVSVQMMEDQTPPSSCKEPEHDSAKPNLLSDWPAAGSSLFLDAFYFISVQDGWAVEANQWDYGLLWVAVGCCGDESCPANSSDQYWPSAAPHHTSALLEEKSKTKMSQYLPSKWPRITWKSSVGLKNENPHLLSDLLGKNIWS